VTTPTRAKGLIMAVCGDTNSGCRVFRRSYPLPVSSQAIIAVYEGTNSGSRVFRRSKRVMLSVVEACGQASPLTLRLRSG